MPTHRARCGWPIPTGSGLVDAVRLAGRHTRPLHPSRSGRRSTIVVAEAGGKRTHGTIVPLAAVGGRGGPEGKCAESVGSSCHRPLSSCARCCCCFPAQRADSTRSPRTPSSLASHGCAALVAGPVRRRRPAARRAAVAAGACAARALRRCHPLARRPTSASTRARVSAMADLAWSRGPAGDGGAGGRPAAGDRSSPCHPSSATWVGLGEHGSLVGIPAWTPRRARTCPAVQTDDRAVLSDIARQALHRRGPAAPLRPGACCTSPARYAPKLDDAGGDRDGRDRGRSASTCAVAARRRREPTPCGRLPRWPADCSTAVGKRGPTAAATRSAADLSRRRSPHPARLLADHRHPHRDRSSSVARRPASPPRRPT